MKNDDLDKLQGKELKVFTKRGKKNTSHNMVTLQYTKSMLR